MRKYARSYLAYYDPASACDRFDYYCSPEQAHRAASAMRFFRPLFIINCYTGSPFECYLSEVKL